MVNVDPTLARRPKILLPMLHWQCQHYDSASVTLPMPNLQCQCHCNTSSVNTRLARSLLHCQCQYYHPYHGGINVIMVMPLLPCQYRCYAGNLNFTLDYASRIQCIGVMSLHVCQCYIYAVSLPLTNRGIQYTLHCCTY